MIIVIIDKIESLISAVHKQLLPYLFYLLSILYIHFEEKKMKLK